jgi:hypothetical protein
MEDLTYEDCVSTTTTKPNYCYHCLPCSKNFSNKTRYAKHKKTCRQNDDVKSANCEKKPEKYAAEEVEPTGRSKWPLDLADLPSIGEVEIVALPSDDDNYTIE